MLIIWCRCAFWDNGVDEQPNAAVYRRRIDDGNLGVCASGFVSRGARYSYIGTAMFRPYSYAGFYRHRQGHSGLRGIAMSEPIKSQSISRRRLFWLAVTAAALGAPATMLSTSDVRAQQSDQAPAAEPTAPKTGEKKKKKTKTKKKATPGATTAPASGPPTPPKQQ